MTHLDTRPWPRRALLLPGLFRSHYRALRRSNARYTSARLAWSLARTVLVPGPKLRREILEGVRYPKGYGFAWVDFASGWEKVAYSIPLNLILRGLRSGYIRMVRAKRHRVTMDAYRAGLDTATLLGCSGAGCRGIDQGAIADALERVNKYLEGEGVLSLGSDWVAEKVTIGYRAGWKDGLAFHPDLARVVVSVDPAGNGDECGIMLARKGEDGHLYILAEKTVTCRKDGQP